MSASVTDVASSCHPLAKGVQKVVVVVVAPVTTFVAQITIILVGFS
ncbi:MAG: hypothetical protein WAM42_14975 [Candidatus Nitrosopolaris sp.]